MYKLLIKNKIKLEEYKIYKTYTAGIVLQANEVKTVLRGACSLIGSYVYFINGAISIMKMYIQCTEYNTRLLLLKHKEINRLRAEFTIGRSVIPVCIKQYNNLIKLELILCQKIAKYQIKKITKIREIDIKEARKLNVLKIKI
jgi:SsrA-binding protein